jgi:hypothetical protein
MQSYKPEEIRLANEISETLKDPYSVTLFLKFARKYKEKFLREMLEKTMKIKDKDVLVTRGAIFTSLVKRYGYDNTRT